MTDIRKSLLLAGGIALIAVSTQLAAKPTALLLVYGLDALVAVALYRLADAREEWFVVEHWRGRLSLMESVGLAGVLVPGGLAAIFMAVMTYAPVAAEAKRSLFVWVGVPLLFGVVVWLVVGIWRSAACSRQTHWTPLWPAAARAFAIGCIILAGMLAFVVVRGSFSDADEEPAVLACAGNQLMVIGDLTQGVAARVDAALQRTPGVTVIRIESRGAAYASVKDLGDIISRRKLITYTERICAGLCALAFLQGEQRIVHKNAQIVLHRPPLGAARSQFVARGIPPWFIDRVYSTVVEEPWYPTHDELLRASFVSRISDGVEFTLEKASIKRCD